MLSTMDPQLIEILDQCRTVLNELVGYVGKMLPSQEKASLEQEMNIVHDLMYKILPEE